MPHYLLHADYDQDGRVSKSRTELSRSNRPPGAIVLANLDLDTPATGSPPVLDRKKARKPRADDDLVPLIVTVLPGTQTNTDTADISLSKEDAGRIRVFDSGQ